MMASAFAPGNVSGVFKIVRDDDPRRMHSLGMGFTVSHGVSSEVAEAPATEVSFNGEVFDFPTVRHVTESLASRPVRVRLETELPLSGGFGLSGASALATAYAIDSAFDLGLDEHELGMTAHVAEVTNLTGLGDVCGQFRGGCLAKLVPGDPLASVALPVPEQPVFYRYFSPIRTRDIIGNPDRAARINAAADAALADLETLADQQVTAFTDYVMVARRFAVASELLRHPRREANHRRRGGRGRRGVDDHAGQCGVCHNRVRGSERDATGPGPGEGHRMTDVPASHPRYESLRARDTIVDGVEKGVTSIHGLVAHGRGEAFDYLLGERTRDFARQAIDAAAAMLVTAGHPVVSVNGNTAALVPAELVALARAVEAPLEVNVFHASKARERAIRDHMVAHGAPRVLMPTEHAVLDHIDSNRRFVNPEGIHAADVVFVPLEDGDRCQALVKSGRRVITVDLNPMSRTSMTASVTIVDNVTRALPLLLERVVGWWGDPAAAAALLARYDNGRILRGAEAAIRAG